MEFQNQLEEILLENHHNYKIDSKSSLKEALSKLNDISIDMYFGNGTFQQAELIENKIRNLLKQEVQKGTSCFLSIDNEVLISPSAKKNGYYQITYFDQKGPISDSQQPSLEKTVEYMSLNNIFPLKEEYVEYLNTKDQPRKQMKEDHFKQAVKLVEMAYQLGR